MKMIETDITAENIEEMRPPWWRTENVTSSAD